MHDPAPQALGKTGLVLGRSPLRVLPSKTAIVPVNRDLMPRTDGELERCSRTVYVANIDRKVDKGDVRNFFQQLCGEPRPRARAPAVPGRRAPASARAGHTGCLQHCMRHLASEFLAGVRIASTPPPHTLALHVAGQVSKIRLLGDPTHPTRIAFVEFAQAEGAMAALNCSGALLGEPRRPA